MHQVKLLAQRSVANGFEGRSSDAVSDAKAAIAAALMHNSTLAHVNSTLGAGTVCPTPPPTEAADPDAGVPVCILPPGILTQLRVQLCQACVQSCDFAGVGSVVRDLSAVDDHQTIPAATAVFECVGAEVANVVEAADELASSDTVEAVRSYYVALEGVATQRVSDVAPSPSSIPEGVSDWRCLLVLLCAAHSGVVSAIAGCRRSAHGTGRCGGEDPTVPRATVLGQQLQGTRTCGMLL